MKPRKTAIQRRLSRQEAAEVLVRAFSAQRPTIAAADAHFSLRLPAAVWVQVVEAFAPLAGQGAALPTSRR